MNFFLTAFIILLLFAASFFRPFNQLLYDFTKQEVPFNQTISKTKPLSFHVEFLSPLITQSPLQIKVEPSDITKHFKTSIIYKDDSIDLNQQAQIIEFTPTQSGRYQLVLQSDTYTQTTEFIIRKEASFDTAQLSIIDKSDSLESSLGFIDNQYWVISNTLSKNAVADKIKRFASLDLLAFDPLFGWLIEVNTDKPDEQISLKSLRQSTGIDGVLPRLYEGPDYQRLEQPHAPALHTNDYDDWGEGAKENWHLKATKLPEAWMIHQGSSSITVGISDGGFDPNHEELDDKISLHFPHNYSKDPEKSNLDHGTAVAGTIAALSQNHVGVSGINFHAPLVLGYTGLAQWTRLTQQNNVRVLNASWALSNHIPADFDVTDAHSVAQRAQNAFKLTRHFRKIAELNPDKLFVFSAGNGIGNGKGHNGHYGIEGDLHSPALHLSALNTIDKLPNVMFVGAVTDDLHLSHTSTYGELVDLAAPAYYKSLASQNSYKTDNRGSYGYSAGFKGTSAAAPVVSGIASLIFGINPSLKGRDVKKLLIENTHHTITKRYTGPNKKSAILAHPIPLIDAYGALKAAKAANKGLGAVHASHHNPFTKTITLSSSNITFLEEQTATIELESENDLAQVTLQSDKLEAISLAVMNNETGETTLIDLPVNLATLQLELYDENKNPIQGRVDIRIDHTNTPVTQQVTQGHLSEKQVLYLLTGNYNITVDVEGYHPSTFAVALSKGETLLKTLQLVNLASNETATLEGWLVDEEGKVIPHAEVSLKLEGQSSPPFTTHTDGQGFFQFPQLTTETEAGMTLSYSLNTHKKGYRQLSPKHIVLLAGETASTEITLINLEDE